MTMNEANWERGARAAMGLGLLSVAFVGPKTPWGYLGLVPLLSGTVGFCPLYAALGVSTRRR